jgi:tetratricopeptide (TPR) repeat protein
MYLEGSVQIRGNKIRVIVQLIDSATGNHILARTFDRPKTDFFDIRDEVTELTVSSLRAVLPQRGSKLSLRNTADPDLDVYVLYRRGIDQLSKPRTAATLATAHGWFDAALALDPDYAAAHAGKCHTYVRQFIETSETALAALAEETCSEAIELDPKSDIVYVALGRLHVAAGRHTESEDAFREALRINEQSVDAMVGLSEVLLLQNRANEAEARLHEAIELQPGNTTIYSNLGAFLYRQGRYAEAAEQFREVVLISPENGRGLTNLASAYMLSGDFAAALSTYTLALEFVADRLTYMNFGLVNYYLGNYKEAEGALRQAIALTPEHHLSWTALGDVLFIANNLNEAREAYLTADSLLHDLLAINPNDPASKMDHAWIHASLGEQTEARAEIGAALLAAPDDPYGYYFDGLICQRFGDNDAALDALELAVAKGYSTTMLSAEPLLAELRDHPRFIDMTRTEDKGRK